MGTSRKQELLSQKEEEEKNVAKEVWREFYLQYNQDLLKYIRTLCGCSMLAQDILQDTFFVAFENILLGRYKEQGKGLA